MMSASETASSRGGFSDFSEDEIDGPNLAPTSRSRTPPLTGTADLPVAVTCRGMREDLFTRIKVISVQALNRHRTKREVASHIKQELDKDADFMGLVGEDDWQVTVGESFASTGATRRAMHANIAVFDIPTYQETVTIFKSTTS
eukprot:TRINITY_DN13712_c0_g1_i1.p2 TRINITY_DN13712_c0_g1~~TRINITY_DN13712_c0_g1_i1.p2  ORF type:complete len:144 (+),score=22.68 TRINITY_DN13712_c0_g1_i1:110-541(+)